MENFYGTEFLALDVEFFLRVIGQYSSTKPNEACTDYGKVN